MSETHDTESDRPGAAQEAPGLTDVAGNRGHGIFINGIQSAGKSTVAADLQSHTSTFRVITGDDVVREVPEEQRLMRWREIFATVLARTEASMVEFNLVVDAAWTDSQVREAQRRFGSSGLFVVLRIDEQERRRRESIRRDRKLAYWDPAWHSMPGPDNLYDLVIDTKAISPRDAAATILVKAVERWPDLVL